MVNKVEYAALGSFVFAGAGVATFFYSKRMTTPFGADPHQGACAFDRLAASYDRVVGNEERFMGYWLMRWWLLRQAKGDVLEISTGTGRNLPYYDYKNLTSLTLSDVSAAMLSMAEDKYFKELRINWRHPDHVVSFAVSDAQDMVAAPGTSVYRPFTGRRPVPWQESSAQSGANAKPALGLEANPTQAPNSPTALSPFRQLWRSNRLHALEEHAQMAQSLPSASEGAVVKAPSGVELDHVKKPVHQELARFAPHSFDVVVDTFGLCSVSDPVKVLQQASSLLRPGGMLLLLEHGRSSWGWLNAKLDEGEERHRQHWGCTWNRDILALIEQAGLEVKSSSRWHFGTSYLVVARAPLLGDKVDA